MSLQSLQFLYESLQTSLQSLQANWISSPPIAFHTININFRELPRTCVVAAQLDPIWISCCLMPVTQRNPRAYSARIMPIHSLRRRRLAVRPPFLCVPRPQKLMARLTNPKQSLVWRMSVPLFALTIFPNRQRAPTQCGTFTVSTRTKWFAIGPAGHDWKKLRPRAWTTKTVCCLSCLLNLQFPEHVVLFSAETLTVR